MSNRVFQLNCWFEGHVQGVGFRYQTVCVAKGFEVTGFEMTNAVSILFDALPRL